MKDAGAVFHRIDNQTFHDVTYSTSTCCATEWQLKDKTSPFRLPFAANHNAKDYISQRDMYHIGKQKNAKVRKSYCSVKIIWFTAFRSLPFHCRVSTPLRPARL